MRSMKSINKEDNLIGNEDETQEMHTEKGGAYENGHTSSESNT